MLEKYNCERCGSSRTYMRISTNEKVCQKCGYVIKRSNRKNHDKRNN